ncbi:MAG: hypothetical protein Q7T55_23360, partial [Solirubrobacteraceae bacterium]|nr:hypothetical protein [Solirubrobacteraceae bacterium]
MLVDAAERACTVGAFSTALRIAASADARLRAAAAADPAMALRLLAALYLSQYGLAKLDAGDLTFDRLRTLAGNDATRFADAAARQVLSLSSRGRHREGVALAESLLAPLGLVLPADGAWQDAKEREMTAFLARFQTLGVSAFDALRPMQAPVPRTLMQMLPGTSEAAGEIGLAHTFLAFRMLELALLHGRTPELPFALVSVFADIAWGRGDLTTARELARAGMRMLGHYPDSIASGLVTLNYLNQIGRTFDPPAEVLAAARRTIRVALETGDATIAAYCAFITLSLVKEIGPSLAAFRAEAELTLELANKAGSRDVAVKARMEIRSADVLAGRTR